MSAFIVSDNHINTLVNYAVQRRASYYWKPEGMRVYIVAQNAEKIGQILLDENYRSVNHRYRGEEGEPHRFKFKASIKPIKAVDILKAIDCLDYQSCETDDWEESRAFAILEGIRSCAIRNLPGYEESNGWSL